MTNDKEKEYTLEDFKELNPKFYAFLADLNERIAAFNKENSNAFIAISFCDTKLNIGDVFYVGCPGCLLLNMILDKEENPESYANCKSINHYAIRQMINIVSKLRMPTTTKES